MIPIYPPPMSHIKKDSYSYWFNTIYTLHSSRITHDNSLPIPLHTPSFHRYRAYRWCAGLLMAILPYIGVVIVFKMFKEVMAAFVVIILELCKGTKNLAEAYSATTSVVLEEAKLLVPDEATKATYREVARLEAQAELNQALVKAGNTAKANGVSVSDELQAQLDKLSK